jgi:hypothetical protein
MTTCEACDGDGMTTHEELLPCISGAPGGRWRVTRVTCEECGGRGWLELPPLDEADNL